MSEIHWASHTSWRPKWKTLQFPFHINCLMSTGLLKHRIVSGEFKKPSYFLPDWLHIELHVTPSYVNILTRSDQNLESHRKSALHAFLRSTTVQSNFSCITSVTSFSHTWPRPNISVLILPLPCIILSSAYAACFGTFVSIKTAVT